MEGLRVHLPKDRKHLLRHIPDELLARLAAGEEAEAAQVVESVVFIAERLGLAAICSKLAEKIVLILQE